MLNRPDVHLRMDISKLCGTHLRDSYKLETGEKLKLGHAREFVAAMFGFKSFDSLVNSPARNPFTIDEDGIKLSLVVDFMDKRREKLEGLPDNLLPNEFLIDNVYAFLTNESTIEWLAAKSQGYQLPSIKIVKERQAS